MSTVSLAPVERDNSADSPPIPVVRPWFELLCNAALLGAATLVLTSYALVAFVHRSDRFQVNFISGIYTTLAARLNDGMLYPDLYDGEHFGGTRYMPLPFVLQAGLARLTTDYLIAGKLLAYSLTGILCIELFLILRRIGCGRCAALALIGLVLTSAAGFLAGTTIRGDLLPVVLQLAAMLVATKAQKSRHVAVAGVLCTLGILAKMTAGWAPLVLACYYFNQSRRTCSLFLAVWLTSLFAALSVLHLLSDGRMLVNFTALSAAGVQGPIGFLKAPFCLLLQASQDGALQGFLIPASIIGCVFAVWYRRYSVYHGSLLFSLLILLVIYSDKGSDYNHLLDLVVLSVPVVAHLWVLLYSFDRRVPGFRVAFTCSIIWAGVSSWSNTLAAPFRLAVESMRHDQVEGKRPGKPLVRLIDDDETILSEDPWVVVSRGQVPYILDPYALARLTENRPTLTSGLLCRVRSEEFGKVVLLREADGQRTDDGVEWYQRHLGPELIHAICIHYRLVAQAEGYYVYAPRGEPEKSQSEQASR